MAYNKPTNLQHDAVIAAISIGKCKGYETETQYLQATNKLLSDAGDSVITQSDYDALLTELKQGGVIDDQQRFIINSTYKPRRARGNREFNEQGGIVEQIYLTNKVLLRNNVNYSIIYNCDGQGSIQLPNGSVEYVSLNALNNSIVDEHGFVDSESNGGTLKWIVNTNHHPDVPTNTLFKDYVDDKYPI